MCYWDYVEKEDFSKGSWNQKKKIKKKKPSEGCQAFFRDNYEEQIPTKFKYSAARLEKFNSPYFCIYDGLSKSKKVVCFLSSNISVFPRKTTFSILHPGINLAWI